MSTATSSQISALSNASLGRRLAEDVRAPGVKERLVLVGGGMAAFGLCDRLSRTGTVDTFDVAVFGDEPTPAYDRVNLSKLFSGKTADDLLLAKPTWYSQNSIELHTGQRIVEINRRQRCIRDTADRWFPYDKLILSTGSRAWVPPIPGADLPGVFVYRTLQDLQEIDKYVQDRKASVGAVIGGGLLGLEAAKVLVDLGLKTSVIEMAPGLMPRQLDAKAASLLRQSVDSLGVDVHLVRRTEAIQSNGSSGLTINFANALPVNVDILIIAAGVRPNDDLARSSGLEVGPRGGIVVDETLATSDPNIMAIGECVAFRDHVYGLVAPCYRMADVLAERLAGQPSLFRGADESAELKLLGVQVATLGVAIGEARGGVVLTHENESGYRKIILEKGRIIGAACVGDWDEIAQVRQAINKQSQIWPWQRRRFVKHGSPWSPGGALPVMQWPADSVVCSCLNVTKGTIAKLVAHGNNHPDQIANACGASTACGSCRVLVEQLTGRETEMPVMPGATAMLAASVVALCVTLLWMIAPVLEYADSVQSSWREVDLLWRSDFARQVTGFSLLGFTVLGMVFSARKRMPWFNKGSYSFWRSVHGVLGTAVLIGMIVHTGFRLGANLNWLLGVCFLATGLLGALAGIASSLESKLTGSRAMMVRLWRPRLAKIHLWVTWPLPVLIALHVFSFYWFSD